MKTCPRCGLLAPDSAGICDCGTSFTSNGKNETYCTECGSIIPEACKFCGKCGAKRIDRTLIPAPLVNQRAYALEILKGRAFQSKKWQRQLDNIKARFAPNEVLGAAVNCHYETGRFMSRRLHSGLLVATSIQVLFSRDGFLEQINESFPYPSIAFVAQVNRFLEERIELHTPGQTFLVRHVMPPGGNALIAYIRERCLVAR
jgi:hypothetical protein